MIERIKYKIRMWKFSFCEYILFPFYQWIMYKLFVKNYCGKYKHGLLDDGDNLQLYCRKCMYRYPVNLSISVNNNIKEIEKFLI